jgi:DNA helicase-2/ATP-dependent DNA helicase PcrA
VPDILSATSLVRLNKGETDAWDLIRPLPERPTSARRIGTEVHRLIEESSRGMSAFPEETELDQPSEVSEPGRIGEMLARFREQYGDRRVATLPSGEAMVELPFALRRNGRIVRGRIDAVYETDDGGLEIVDFKTGRRFEKSDDEADQLELYGEALRALGLDGGKAVTLTYAFLGEDSG